MLGAIAGDVIGSIYEGNPIKTIDFEPLFSNYAVPTDDTVLTVAVAESILFGADLVDKLKEYFRLYRGAGYGSSFFEWASSKSREPYNSWGNGSAMRVSPVGFAYDTLDEVLSAAESSAAVTHNHSEGIKGAQATAAAIYLARTGQSKADIKTYIQTTFGYNLDRTLDEIRPLYSFHVSCPRSVPESIIAFLESEGYEDAVRKAISLGGDSDTMACIAGGIAEAFYGGVPDAIHDEVWERLDDRLRFIITQFTARFLQ